MEVVPLPVSASAIAPSSPSSPPRSDRPMRVRFAHASIVCSRMARASRFPSTPPIGGDFSPLGAPALSGCCPANLDLAPRSSLHAAVKGV